MVKVRSSRGRCSGTIIKSNFVLTAAHCVEGAENAWIELGGFYSGDTKIRKRVKQIIIYPGYKFPVNDIALLETSSPIDLNIYTPVCLPKEEDLVGSMENMFKIQTRSTPECQECQVRVPVKCKSAGPGQLGICNS